MKQQDSQNFDLESVITWLEHQNHQVVRPFVPRSFYDNPPSSAPLLKAAILDVETTGTNSLTDKIIELGIVIVEYCPRTGHAYRILETYSELEDPGIPIPTASTKIHGITDEMVNGKSFINTDIENIMKEVSLVIAHNAKFDRQFVEARLPFFQEKAWACSFSQIPWKEEKFGSASLEHLLYRAGFHFNGHRAVLDCHALLEVLQSDLPVSGVKVLKLLLNTAHTPDLKIWALLSPFESKDKLKNRKYRWDSECKSWYTIIAEEDLGQEADWLSNEVYDHRSFQLKQETINAFNRFSIRHGISEIVSY